MSFDFVTESEIRRWHGDQGGSGKRPAGHAVRILRECIELCVASGASVSEISEAVAQELTKAIAREEVTGRFSYPRTLEEFVDVQILNCVFWSYFITIGDLNNEMRRKFDICKERQWEPDADGVLWRPGTRATGGAALEPERS